MSFSLRSARAGWIPFLADCFPRSWALVSGAVSAGAAALFVHLCPGFEFNILAQGAARVAALVCGSSMEVSTRGFAVPEAQVPVIVTAACSAADYFCIMAALVTWQLARRAPRAWVMIPVGLAAAVPLTIIVNALRILSVAHAHRWIIPHFPAAYSSFLHLTAGVAVFLPSLIALQFLFSRHGYRHAVSAR
ncbi:MAG: exosortase/archaeosortase family protein [Opitutus sp.]